MRSTSRWLAMVGAVVIVAGSLAVLGAQEPASMEGELVQVDPDAMTFSIQDADGAEHEFTYTADTEVVGAESGVAGLASWTGQQVLVQHDGPTAIRIELLG